MRYVLSGFRRLRAILCSAASLLRRFRCRVGAMLCRTDFRMGRGNVLLVPVVVNGKGRVRIGDKNYFGCPTAPMMGNGALLIQARLPEASVVIGDGNATSNNFSIIAHDSVTIGNDCRIGDLVTIFDADAHEIDPLKRNVGIGKHAPVHIGNNVWLGSRVMVLKGVTIGDNSVIAAMSVVTKSIPENCVAAGNPAKVIKKIRE